MPVVDCRGLACPQPVVTTKHALDELREGEVIVIVDNTSSCNNVERFALSQGCSVKINESGEDYYIHIHKGVDEGGRRPAQAAQNRKKSSSILTLYSWGAEMKTSGVF